jgi:hypothetical protein
VQSINNDMSVTEVSPKDEDQPLRAFSSYLVCWDLNFNGKIRIHVVF